MRRNPGVRSSLGESGDASDVFDAFRSGDELCVALVLDSARCLGRTIGNLVNVLDCETTVLAGETLKFGEKYLSVLADAVGNSLNPGLACSLQFSSLDDSVSLGARIVGCDLAIKSHLREI